MDGGGEGEGAPRWGRGGYDVSLEGGVDGSYRQLNGGTGGGEGEMVCVCVCRRRQSFAVVALGRKRGGVGGRETMWML